MVLRIGIDASCWQNNRGYGRHTRALLRALVPLDRRNEYTLFLDSDESMETLPERCRVAMVRTSRPSAQAASARGHRSLADMWHMSREMSRGGFDLLLFPTI